MINLVEYKLGQPCKFEGYQNTITVQDLRKYINVFNIYRYRDSVYYIRYIHFGMFNKNINQIEMSIITVGRTINIPIMIHNRTRKCIRLIIKHLSCIITNIRLVTNMNVKHLDLNIVDETKCAYYISDISIPNGMKYVGNDYVVIKMVK